MQLCFIQSQILFIFCFPENDKSTKNCWNKEKRKNWVKKILKISPRNWDRKNRNLQKYNHGDVFKSFSWFDFLQLTQVPAAFFNLFFFPFTLLAPTTSSISVGWYIHTSSTHSALHTAAVVKTNRCAQHSSAPLCCPSSPRRRRRCGCYCLKRSTSWLCGRVEGVRVCVCGGGVNPPLGSINLHRDGEFLAWCRL